MSGSSFSVSECTAVPLNLGSKRFIVHFRVIVLIRKLLLLIVIRIVMVKVFIIVKL